jgi:Transglutaminase-like superfamily.
VKKYRRKIYYILLIISAIILGAGIGLWRVYFGGFHVSLQQTQKIMEEDNSFQYYYRLLDDNEKECYQKIFYVLSHFEDNVRLNSSDINSVQSIFESVIYDHPELYYVNYQFQYRIQGNTMVFMPIYDYDKEQVDSYNQRIEEKTKDILIKAKEQEEPVMRAKVIYDYIIETVNYHQNENDQNILSAFLEGTSVCAGYAKAYQYLLSKADIDAVYMVGKAKETVSQTAQGQGHAWIMLHIHDDYYYSDPTWGDNEQESMKHTCYGYFMMSEKEMLACYKPEVKYEKTKDVGNIFFQQRGCYMSNYDEDILSHAIVNGLENKTRIAEVKCANDEVYQKLKKNIQSSYLGYRLLKENECWSNRCIYSYNDELKLVELYY